MSEEPWLDHYILEGMANSITNNLEVRIGLGNILKREVERLDAGDITVEELDEMAETVREAFEKANAVLHSHNRLAENLAEFRQCTS